MLRQGEDPEIGKKTDNLSWAQTENETQAGGEEIFEGQLLEIWYKGK